MELNKMEKWMLYQTEGSDRYAVLYEMLMVYGLYSTAFSVGGAGA